MKVIDTGHHYQLESLDGRFPQPLIFVKRVGFHYPGNCIPHPGTTMQEVLRALLERARYVNNQIPCIETEMAIQHFQSALALFEIRAKRVKGKALQESTLVAVENAIVCKTCGHISCEEKHS